MARIIKEYNKLPANLKNSVKLLNDLTGKEWVQLSKSVITYGGPIAAKRRKHGAAFPIELAKHFIKLLSAEGDIVLDPFLGVGTVADASTLLNRTCLGFEINTEFYELALQGLDPVDGVPDLLNLPKHQIYHASCMQLLEYIKPESVDLILTSPPYSNLLQKVAEHFAGYTYEKNIYKGQGRKLAKPYSDHIEDLGNLNWEEYKEQIGSLMSLLYQVARQGSFNVWIVRDFRDVEEHIPYVNLHSTIADLAIQKGWILTDIAIWDQSSQRKLVKLGGSKSRRFYFNIGHSYILVFRKSYTGEKFRNA